ncbi:MAG TPA: hypothetical protein PLN33_03365 [Hyphomonadaceae bacterium]|jgi:hypothetical protein|nr:hypothetical protein [Hyphomonadaceae bacterium]HPN07458.1 hypothetical protein [Hyphomonadaceae bacterium]
MSLDLTGINRATVITKRERSIYRDAQDAEFKQRKITNIADLLDRGPRARAGHHTALVVDIKA